MSLRKIQQFSWIPLFSDEIKLLLYPRARISPSFWKKNKVKGKENHCFFQGKGYGGKIFDFAESLAKITQIDCVSCRTDLFPFYEKRGYIEIERVPAEEYDEMKGTITRSGLEMVIMQKSQK